MAKMILALACLTLMAMASAENHLEDLNLDYDYKECVHIPVYYAFLFGKILAKSDGQQALYQLLREDRNGDSQNLLRFGRSHLDGYDAPTGEKIRVKRQKPGVDIDGLLRFGRK